jgi:hypothetical protein
VQKESLAPILHSLAGVVLKGDSVVLDLGQPPNEFLRRQLKENLDVIAQAASSTLGRTVAVLLGEPQPEMPEVQPGSAAADQPSQEDTLERAKREPTVQSFLDTFPGPVTAENLKP